MAKLAWTIVSVLPVVMSARNDPSSQSKSINLVGFELCDVETGDVVAETTLRGMSSQAADAIADACFKLDQLIQACKNLPELTPLNLDPVKEGFMQTGVDLPKVSILDIQLGEVQTKVTQTDACSGASESTEAEGEDTPVPGVDEPNDTDAAKTRDGT